MSQYVEPPHKTAAQREADDLLLRNAPDEDQVLREYLAKRVNALVKPDDGSGPKSQQG